MPRGPNGEWRPADYYRAPKNQRRPHGAAVGGRARAAKMGPEERSASAKRASAARWAGVLAALLLTPALAAGQAASETARWQTKADRVAAVQGEPRVRNLLPPGRSTATRDYLGFELHQGGLYEPSIFPTDTWLEIACIHADLETPYNRTQHGSSLLRIHAIVYDADLDEIHNTIDTTASDEAICNLSSSVDTSFVELPRATGRKAAAVAFIAIPSARQYVEPSKLIYRVLPR